MKQTKNIIKLLLIWVICFISFCSSSFADTGVYTGAFPDVPTTASYAKAAEALRDMGILNGDDKGNFNPDSTITRAESAAIICRLMDVEDEAKTMNKQVFNDVPSSHWAVGYVAKAADMGIINGYGNGRFGPGDPVTFEQIIKMLVCAWGFDDEAESVGGWPNGYINIAKDLKMLLDVSFQQREVASRASVALITYNLLEN